MPGGVDGADHASAAPIRVFGSFVGRGSSGTKAAALCFPLSYPAGDFKVGNSSGSGWETQSDPELGGNRAWHLGARPISTPLQPSP